MLPLQLDDLTVTDGKEMTARKECNRRPEVEVGGAGGGDDCLKSVRARRSSIQTTDQVDPHSAARVRLYSTYLIRRESAAVVHGFKRGPVVPKQAPISPYPKISIRLQAPSAPLPDWSNPQRACRDGS